MTRYEIHIPDGLADWIDRKMPGIGGVRTVKIQCCKVIPLEWFFGRASALTLWRTVSLRNTICPIDPCNRTKVALLLHELVHVEQFRASPVWFPIKYLLNLFLRGYWYHPAEVEARIRAHDLIESYTIEDPCHCAEATAKLAAEVLEIIRAIAT
ncbi:MAG: hypothetical protein LAP21_13765 [Acidobacteriia bacterium]|nr:hypothetical protein [Terriglobia bacterium]